MVSEYVETFAQVCPAGLEPTTYCLEGSCSIRLSYRHMFYKLTVL